MRTIAVTNHKGGSGKTTTAVNLAAALGEQGYTVLLGDLDPQCSTSHWLGATDPDRGMDDVLCGNAELADVLAPTGEENLWLAPASPGLMGVEKKLAAEVGAEQLLRRSIERLPNGRFDYLLLDCPPSLGLLTHNAFAASADLLLTVEAHVMALSGLVQLLHTAELVKGRLNPELELFGIVACRVDRRTRHARDVVESLRERFAELVFDTVISESVRLAEAPSFRQPITRYAPGSTGAADYRGLAAEVIARSSSSWQDERPSPKILSMI